MRKALYAGSFDPVTFGHLDVIERAAKDFDELVVVVMNNPDKQHQFQQIFRTKMVMVATQHLENVDVRMGEARLLVDIAKMWECPTLVRGLRFVSDLEAELNFALNNDVLAKTEIHTIWYPARQQNIHISSSAARQVYKYGSWEDLQMYVPLTVANMLEFCGQEEKETLFG